jgi:hypothetical protein
MGDWLHRLHTLIGEEIPAPLVPIGANRGQNSISAANGTIGTGISRQFSPPYDADGVPCGLCPTCHRGEFWRRPKFHKEIPAAGCAGSAPLHPRVVAPATFAACPRTTNDDSNGKAPSQVGGWARWVSLQRICRCELIVDRSRDPECDAARDSRELGAFLPWKPFLLPCRSPWPV